MEITYMIVKNPESESRFPIGGTYAEDEFEKVIEYLKELRNKYPENKYFAFKKTVKVECLPL